MSRPCDLEYGNYYTQAPKLQGATCASKIVVCFFCILCLSVTGIAIAALSALPVVDQAREAFHSTPPRQQKPLPAVLRRFLNLKRAPVPDHGAELGSIEKLFPTWGRGPDWSVDDFVRDMSLALSSVAERLADPELDSKISPFRGQTDL